MDAFVPLFLLLMIWIMIGVPLSVAKKATERQKKNAAAPPRQVQVPESPPLQEEPLQVLTPTVSPPRPDLPPYRGSLDADTGEGYDPCHDEQMASLTLAEQEEPPLHPQPASSGIPLGWTENDMVRGIVMSEILNRKR